MIDHSGDTFVAGMEGSSARVIVAEVGKAFEV